MLIKYSFVLEKRTQAWQKPKFQNFGYQKNTIWVRVKERHIILGKRITSNFVSESGKRPREMYSFGIGE